MTRGRETEREGTTVGAETTGIGMEGIGVVIREGIEAEAVDTIGETATEEVVVEVVEGEVTTGDELVHSPLSVSVLEKKCLCDAFSLYQTECKYLLADQEFK